MDVINFSGGEPEIEPSRDIVVRALNAAAAAGVVSVIAADNNYEEVGAGSIASPASALARDCRREPSRRAGPLRRASTPTSRRWGRRRSRSSSSRTWRRRESASSRPCQAAAGRRSPARAWPRPMSPELPLSSSSAIRPGRWVRSSPHSSRPGPTRRARVAARSGLSSRVAGSSHSRKADRPLLFADPVSLSLGLLARDSRSQGTIELTDAGDGIGTWQVRQVRTPGGHGRASLRLPSTVDVPGELGYELVVPSRAAQGDVAGYIELQRGADVRRIPFFGRVTVAALEQQSAIRADGAGRARRNDPGQARASCRATGTRTTRAVSASRPCSPAPRPSIESGSCIASPTSES